MHTTPDGPVVEVMTITPQIAAAWLKLNVANRKVRQTTVDRYARDMASGNWRFTGDSIKRNGSKLQDGQHRLLACVQSGAPFETVVVTGIEDDAHAAIDAGVKRTLSDELRWRNSPNPPLTASTLLLLWKWRNGLLTSPGTATRAEALELWEANQTTIEDAVRVGHRVWQSTGILPSVTSAMFCEITQLHGYQVAEHWVGHLEAGTNYREGDPALALRSWALRVKSTKTIRPRQNEWLAVCIKAFNMWFEGRTTKLLIWRSAGRMAEDFPTLTGPEEDF